MNNLSSTSNRKGSEFWTSILTYGLIIGGSIVLSDLIMVHLLGFQDNILASVCSVIGVYFSQKYYRDTHGGYITYGKALKFGTFAMGAAGVIRGLYTVLMFKFVPGLWDKVILLVEEAYVNMGMSDADVATMLNPIKEGISPFAIAISFVMASMFSGFFISLLSSVFIKRSNPDSFNDAMNGAK
ncbi:MAG: DUF4199 domain-containing protein [Mangrovibacterium sp.]